MSASRVLRSSCSRRHTFSVRCCCCCCCPSQISNGLLRSGVWRVKVRLGGGGSLPIRRPFLERRASVVARSLTPPLYVCSLWCAIDSACAWCLAFVHVSKVSECGVVMHIHMRYRCVCCWLFFYTLSGVTYGVSVCVFGETINVSLTAHARGDAGETSVF